MSSLSARERRILTEIEHDLATAEPRLQEALASARLPVFQYRSVVRSGHPKLRRCGWVIGLAASLLCGISLLATGIVFSNFPLIFAGIPLTQFSPFAVGWLVRNRFRPAS